MLFAILLAPKLTLAFAKVYFTFSISSSAYLATLSSASLKISSKFLFLGFSPTTVKVARSGLGWVWMCSGNFGTWPSNFPVIKAFLMSSYLFLGLSALNAVEGLDPFVLTSTGMTFSKLTMFSALWGGCTFLENSIPIFLVAILADSALRLIWLLDLAFSWAHFVCKKANYLSSFSFLYRYSLFSLYSCIPCS